MAEIVGLPKLSPTMEEGTLVTWHKKEGERIEPDDLLAEVETDKATVEFRSFWEGTLLAIVAEEGAVLRPGDPVAIVGEEGEDVSALLEQARAAAATPSTTKETQSITSPASGEKPQGEASTTAHAAPVDAEPARTPSTHGDRVLASPLVRRLARERGLDLRTIRGSGPGGRIVKRDLDRLPAETPASDLVAPPSARPSPRIEAASSMRRTIARRLVQSKQQVPHYYLKVDVEVGALLQARSRLNELLAEEGIKLSLNDFVLRAAAVALRRWPEVNVSWRDGQVARHQVVDISVAVAVEEGLLTPVVRDADRKGMVEIAQEVRRLATLARERKLRPEQMQGGTFSVSNLGMFGVDEFAAVINPPEGAILAVGRVREAAVVRDGQLRPGHMMSLTLSCDHRVIDGAVGGRWLHRLRSLLEEPAALAL